MLALPRFTSSLPTVATVALTCTLAVAAYAQTAPEATPPAVEPKAEQKTAQQPESHDAIQSAADLIEGLLPQAATEATPTVVPLESQISPATPWPQMAQTPSQTVPLPQNLLAFTGVQESAKNLMKADFETWATYLGDNPKVEALGVDLYKTFGCSESDCDSQRSLLIVHPMERKVFVALVSENKVIMRPSLMSWPDAAIPALKKWLADATTND